MPFTAKKPNAIDIRDLKSLGKSVVDLAKYCDDEFAQVASALQSDDPFTIWYKAPTRPRLGMLVYADGTHWNPGSGEGFYEYTSGGVWVPLTTSLGGVSGGAFTFNNASGIRLVTRDIQLFQATAAQFGAVKPDGTTITATGGVLSTVTPLPSPIHAALGADVALNNVANFFDGPSIAQGSVGTFFVSGTVTLNDSSGAANFVCKLWDGTTVIASSKETSGGAGFVSSVSLSGIITSPAGNLKISVKDLNFTTGKILFNNTGESKDSTITAWRLA